jgi:hypothetical protein
MGQDTTVTSPRKVSYSSPTSRVDGVLFVEMSFPRCHHASYLPIGGYLFVLRWRQQFTVFIDRDARGITLVAAGWLDSEPRVRRRLARQYEVSAGQDKSCNTSVHFSLS